MSPRNILLSLSAVLIVVGLVLGFRTASADGVGCGSVFSPSSAEAELKDAGEAIAGTLEGATPDDDTSNVQSACESAISDAKPLAYGAVGAGFLALLLAFVASGRRESSA